MGPAEPVFLAIELRKYRVLTLPARLGRAGRGTRESESIFSTLRARRAGHGSRARARPRGREPGPITPPAQARGRGAKT